MREKHLGGSLIKALGGDNFERFVTEKKTQRSGGSEKEKKKNTVVIRRMRLS